VRVDGTGASPQHITAHGAWLYYSILSPIYGRELHRSDGTGTTASGVSGSEELVADVRSGSASSDPQWLTSAGAGSGPLYFTADDGNFGRELWAATGSSAGGSGALGAAIVADIAVGSASSDPQWLTWHTSLALLFFTADGGNVNGGRELWVRDVALLLCAHRTIVRRCRAVDIAA
jgi:ELWxxDGT repeat protein